MKKIGRLGVIFTVVFIDFLGLSFILPLYANIADRFGLSATVITLLSASYALMQFLFSPILGKLSDRIGRKPVLLLSSLGTAFSFVFFGLASATWMLFASRILNGIFGSSAAVAQAYMADITNKEERTGAMGLLGAALGLGLIFGPALSAILGGFGFGAPAFGAAVLAFINFILILFYLKESLAKNLRVKAGPLKLGFNTTKLIEVLKHPLLNGVLVTYFIFTFALAAIQNIAVLFAEERFHLTLQENGYFFAVVGLAMILTQGFIVGRLEKFWGERLTLIVGMIFLALGYILTPLIEHVAVIAVGAGFISMGAGLYVPAVNAIVSKNFSTSQQGEAFGVVNALIGAALIFGPIFGGVLFDLLGSGSPFFAAGILTLISIYFSLKSFGLLREI